MRLFDVVNGREILIYNPEDIDDGSMSIAALTVGVVLFVAVIVVIGFYRKGFKKPFDWFKE